MDTFELEQIQSKLADGLRQLPRATRSRLLSHLRQPEARRSALLAEASRRYPADPSVGLLLQLEDDPLALGLLRNELLSMSRSTEP
jgi:hypothetical protein